MDLLSAVRKLGMVVCAENFETLSYILLAQDVGALSKRSLDDNVFWLKNLGLAKECIPACCINCNLN